MEDFPKRDLDDYFCRFTFGQFITLILLEVVTLFFVFYLGARYGSDLVGSREERLHDPDAQTSGKSVNDIVGHPPVDYTYPEVLTGRGEQGAIRIKPSGVTAEDYARRPSDYPKDPRLNLPEPAQPEAVAVEPSAAATPRNPEPLPEEPVAPVPTEEPAPPPAPAVKPKGAFAIQVGSYPTPEEAAQILARWKKKGYAAYQLSAEIPGRGTWYRVRLGGFAKRDEATKYLERFRTKEKIDAIIVPTKN